MNTPRVSVLMPVRDAEPWLNEALDSIVAQSETDWELVAVDDGSNDLSRAILENRARSDRRVSVISSGGRGLVAALNLGLERARAPMLARMDADDIAGSRRLELQCAALDDDPQLFGVACRVVAHPPGAAGDGMQRYLDWQNSLHTPEEIARDRFIESPVLHPSVMMRTAPLREQLAGWQDRGWAEDWDLFLRALAAGLRISRVDDPLLAWRVHDRQATRADPRYTEERLLDCRAHHLSRHLCAAFSDRPVWILGAGPVGKSLCKALAGEGLEVGGLVDVDPRKVGGRVRAGRREWPVVAMETLFDVTPRPFAVWAVGRPGGRAGLRALMRDRGWEEGHDFVCAA